MPGSRRRVDLGALSNLPRCSACAWSVPLSLSIARRRRDDALPLSLSLSRARNLPRCYACALPPHCNIGDAFHAPTALVTRGHFYILTPTAVKVSSAAVTLQAAGATQPGKFPKRGEQAAARTRNRSLNLPPPPCTNYHLRCLDSIASFMAITRDTRVIR